MTAEKKTATDIESQQAAAGESLLARHTSPLPNLFYILSFAPPLPALHRHPRDFALHPYTLYTVGIISACISGVGLPAFDIVFGYWTNGVSSENAGTIQSRGDSSGLIMTLVGVVFICTTCLFLVCFSLAGAKLSNLLREQYLAAMLSQDQAFFDRIGSGEIVTKVSRDMDTVRVGFGDRLGYLIWCFAAIITAFVSAMYHAPRLGGVLFALIPITMSIFAGLGYWAESVSKRVSETDGKTSSFIEQIISSVRVVQSFNMSQRLIARLEHGLLGPLRILARRRALVKALEQGVVYGAGFIVYSACFWYGGIEVTRGTSVGDVLTTFYNYVNLFFSLATIMPHFLATSAALHSLANLRLQIERVPAIDVRDTAGSTLADFIPSFSLENVTFAYPSRPSTKVLDGVSVDIEPGSFTAFVGPSGSGKSTLGGLLMRLYDPDSGVTNLEEDRKIVDTITTEKEKKEKDSALQNGISGGGIVRMAGHDIRNLNLKWLRSQVSVVLQNPQLFSGTVFDNVAIGLTGTDLAYRLGIDNVADPSPIIAKRLELIRERVEEALKLAEAWDFVQDLPDGIHTRVTGGRTGVLSGGQVQRIAIARALVRRPRCLFLDEATSAVSADTEAQIQRNIHAEQKKRSMTMIVIAHRLSTITDADKIVVMVDGQVRTQGKYDDLMRPDWEDQTFRSMATASFKRHLAKTESLEDASSANVVSLEQQGQVDIDGAIPPPLSHVRKAFLHVKAWLTTGVLLGMAAGTAFVVAAWLHGRAVAALTIPDFGLLRASTDRWALWFLILAIGALAVTGINAFSLEYSGERIISELRRESVRTLVQQEIAFFEDTNSGTGSLTAAVSSHPAKVGMVVGVILAQCIISLSNLIGTLVMAFVLSWRLAVLVLPALAVAAICGYLNYIYLERFEADIVGDTDKQADFVGESANQITTIASFSREVETLRIFRQDFTTGHRVAKRNLVVASFMMGGSQGMLHLFGALLFWWGSKQVVEGHVTLANLFTVFEAVIICIYVSAKILTYSGDFTRMRQSLRTIQSWIDRKPKYTEGAQEGHARSNNKGIEFKGVSLRYPTRPDVLSLDEVDLHMEEGKTYAFCGTSGAGKSSILAVLQRFYETTGGAILLDGVDVRDIPLEDYRAQMGYVSQEAVLFEGSVRWNLLMGPLDPTTVTDSEIESALEKACMLDFVRGLENGLDTDLGMKGSRLSGGQRQRLCIARALLRNPKILLLDEATSALDGQNEAMVQQAIDNASAGRITIVIAHRLSTIRKADVIHVMERGRVVEAGSHDDLINQKGRYFELVQTQL